jgi:DNA-binding NarL/FixJ family response regulator
MQPSEPRSPEIERGRLAYEHWAWADAYTALTEADGLESLGQDDLARLAIAAFLIGRDDECITSLVRLHREAARTGDAAAAARSAFWLVMVLTRIGDSAQSSGWLARGTRALDEARLDVVERGYLMVPVGLHQQESDEPGQALATFVEVGRIAGRFDDPDLATLARLGEGDAVIALGDVRRGMALLDEAMVAVTAGEVSPVVVGIVYCAVIETCHALFDLRRAQEWTAALARWCETQPDMVPYRGQCHLYRAELKQFHGLWQEAAAEARAAGADRPADQPIAGEAYYRQAELHRLRGEFAHAEAAYRRSSRLGRRPQPGLALLRLAQGRTDQAATSMRTALEEATPRVRPHLLDPLVEILIANGDIAGARAAADELHAIATSSDAPLLGAMAARAEGAVTLAEGDPRGALATLRRASEAWQVLDAPYEIARTRALLAEAARASGDADGASLELEAARDTFLRLGAETDLRRTDLFEPGGGARPGVDARAGSAGPLTARELEVLRLVAVGKSNRVIATDLVISEKTVARHVANIFTKLDLTSRSAATAYAYDQGLVRPRPRPA